MTTVWIASAFTVLAADLFTTLLLYTRQLDGVPPGKCGRLDHAASIIDPAQRHGATIALAAAGTLAICFILDKRIGFRIDEQGEIEGLDRALHSEDLWPYLSRASLNQQP